MPADCDELVAHYGRRRLYLSEAGSAGSGAAMSERLTRRVREACASDGAAARDAIVVRPRVRGDALLFLSAVPEDGRVLRHTWHAGCPVRAGRKATMQKFKECTRGVCMSE